jgi:hypothetical protein
MADTDYVLNILAPATSVRMPAADVNVAATYKAKPPQLYALTILWAPDVIPLGVTGAGSYLKGDVVNVSAPPMFPDNSGGTEVLNLFETWGATGGAVVADVTSPATSITMPAADVVLTAFYKSDGKFILTMAEPVMTDGSAIDSRASFEGTLLPVTGRHFSSDAVQLAAPTGVAYLPATVSGGGVDIEFHHWEGPDRGSITGAAQPNAVLTMPARNLTVRAVYNTWVNGTFTLCITGDGPQIKTLEIPDTWVQVTAPPANPVPGLSEGRVFDRWEASAGQLDDVNASPTMFLMPARDVNLQVYYKVAPPATKYTLALKGAAGMSGGGLYEQDAVVNVTTPLWISGNTKKFSSWSIRPTNAINVIREITDLGSLADPSDPSTTFNMPPTGITLTAQYRLPPAYAVVVPGGEQLTGGGQHVEGSQVTLWTAPFKKVGTSMYDFREWRVTPANLTLALPRLNPITFTMPGFDVVIVAEYVLRS